MTADLNQVIQILRREYLFEGLETDQIARVAKFFEQIEVEKGRLIFREGSPPDYFYLILEGQVRLTRRVRGKTQQINYLGPGDYLGEMSLLFRHPLSATAMAMGPATLLRLSPNRFHLLMKEYPQIRMNLSATAESRKLVQKIHFDWLGPDEVIYYVTRKHVFFLIMKLFWPVLLLGIAAALVIYMLIPSGFSIVSIALCTLFLLAALLLGIWDWIDWSNDYYIVTSQRVVWQEKIVVFYDSRREAPLDAVLAVNVSSDQIGRILDYGNVDIRTFTGGVLMRRMNQPKRFASFVDGYRKRVVAISREKEKEKIEEDLERALHPSSRPEITEPPTVRIPLPTKRKKTHPKRRSVMGQILATFLKVRYEDGEIITYRKHWFVLVRKTWLSLVSITVFTLLLVFMIRSEILQTALVCIAAPIYLILLGWLVYQYLDWNNDIYQLTPEQILDIEKKPLGREQKKTAGLDAPDFRVEHTRENLLNILLNFGTVTISIGQTQFVFNGVYNPDQVHQDVADYREAFIRRKRREEARREHDRMVEWLVTYHNKTDRLEDHENPGGLSGNSG